MQRISEEKACPFISCNRELHRREGEDLRATVMSVQYGNVRMAVATLDGYELKKGIVEEFNATVSHQLISSLKLLMERNEGREKRLPLMA